MGILKDMSKSWKFYFPLSRREKEEYLEKVSAAVKRYKPLIEERTGVDLGEVRVRRFDRILSDLYHEKYADKGFREKKVFYVGWPFVKLYLMGLEDFETMCIYDSTIYVPFGFQKKPEIVWNTIDPDGHVVHELTHRLWKSVENGNDKGNGKARGRKTWEEGFATYGKYDWFSDFYPEGCRVGSLDSLFGYYRKGRDKIKDLVEKHGQEILLEIPNRWQEFSE